uniref:syntenin-2 isoform X1 n=1 Tax=Nyctereutes procyonoides TaxID=34880 RepID=UPI0024442CDD|nr:syntenin-2 isoform X1 [Nyctereutes procyonoides]
MSLILRVLSGTHGREADIYASSHPSPLLTVCALKGVLRNSHVYPVPVSGGPEDGPSHSGPGQSCSQDARPASLPTFSQEVQQNLLQIPEGAGMVGSGLSPGQLLAPLSGNSLGTRRAEIKPGVREIYLCKDEHGKTGLRLRAIDQGLFVQLVKANSPASLVGLRFGDQILQIDGRDCAGWSTDRAHRVLKRASAEKIAMVVRDRPFQRTVTMHKDSTGHVGFVIKKGTVVSVVRGSSAARNGLLTKQSVCEVNGQNVVGLKDKAVTEILAMAGNVVTLTIIPTVIYEHMVKKLSPTLLHHAMDHSIPDF